MTDDEEVQRLNPPPQFGTFPKCNPTFQGSLWDWMRPLLELYYSSPELLSEPSPTSLTFKVLLQ